MSQDYAAAANVAASTSTTTLTNLVDDDGAHSAASPREQLKLCEHKGLKPKGPQKPRATEAQQTEVLQ